jgi:hypothetical protein
VAEKTPHGGHGVEAAARIVAPLELGQTQALYTNHVQVTFTPEDFTLHLGWYALPPLTEPPEGELEVHVRPLAKVTLPLNVVQLVVQLLQRQVEAWEASFGMPIPKHPNPAPGLQGPEPDHSVEPSPK